MPKFNKQISPEVCLEIARAIRAGEISSLKIQARKSGKNKGNILADYTTSESADPIESADDERNKAVQALERVAVALSSGKRVHHFEMHKNDQRYSFSVAVDK